MTLPAHLLPSWHGQVSHLSPGRALRAERGSVLWSEDLLGHCLRTQVALAYTRNLGS